MNGRVVSAAIATVMAAGLSGVGCSSGGGGSKGFSTVAPPITTGSVTSGLPIARRDAAGYTWHQAQLSNVRGGHVSALGVSPTGTATFAAHFPLARVEEVADGQATLSGSLFYDAYSMATVGTQTFAATKNAARAGAGDLHTFEGGAWRLVVDSRDGEMVVGAIGSDVFAAHGGVGAAGTLLQRDRLTGQFAAIAGLDSSIPTAIGGHEGRVVVGASRNDAQGGAARLFKLDATGQLEELGVPGAGGGMNLRQEITGLVSIAKVASGSVAGTGSASIASTGSEVLFVAIGSFDVATGEAKGGSILATDGQAFELIATYTDDAPIGLAAHDSTVYAALRSGRLVYREATGDFVDEPTAIPANGGFYALLSRDDANLFVGARGANGGALLLNRRGNSGSTSTPTPVSTDRYYLTDVKAILQADCASCHMSPGLPVAVTAYGLSANMANDQADFTATTQRTNATTPAMSVLIRKALGEMNHLGGAPIAQGSAKHQILLDWVTQGARLQAQTQQPPQPAPVTYLANVKPIMASCVGCHGTTSGRAFRLTSPANDTADYAAAMGQVNAGTPEQSALLRRPTGQATHPLVVFPQGSANYNTILQWIAQGTRFQ